jgi:hypothetical protein
VSVTIEGVPVENPTAVWMQLMNTRRNVIGTKDRWNSGGWFDNHTSRDRKNPFSMCLANAIRYVSKGDKWTPGTYAYHGGDGRLGDSELVTAEMIVLLAIPKAVQGAAYQSIPEFNDAETRRYHEIVAVLDTAIAMVAPHAKATAIVMADDVMTDEERKEIDRATRKVEQEMWEEERLRWGIHQDAAGVWRTFTGAFAKVPSWVKAEETEAETETDKAPAVPWEAPEPLKSPTRSPGFEWRGWVSDHKKRGWDTFWDELLQCDKDDPTFDACQRAKKALEKV